MSDDVGLEDTELVVLRRAATSSEWPPEPPRPAARPQRRAGFHAVVRRPPTSG